MHRPDLSSLPLDPFWTSIGELDSQAAFERLADAVAFRPEVPPDVAARFDLVRAAVRHAALEAVLADAAFSRALLTLELALARRHEELGSPLPKKKRGLAGLIDWGGTVPLFEDGPAPVHGLRRLRNRLVAHPQGDARAFYHVLLAACEVPSLVNGLYDDPDLRRERLDAWTALRAALDGATAAGAVLDASALGLGRLLVYAAAAPVVENRDGPLRIRVLAWPMFPPPDPSAPTRTLPPIALDAASWSESDDASDVAFQLAEQTGTVTLAPIRDPSNRARFDGWAAALSAGHADLEALRMLAHHHAGQHRHAHRHGAPPPPGGAVIERVAAVPIAPPPARSDRGQARQDRR